METPYVPEHWQNLSLEFTDEYIIKKEKKKIKKEKLNDVSKSPKIMDKAPRKSISSKIPDNETKIMKKPSKKYKYEPSECLDKRPHCVIL